MTQMETPWISLNPTLSVYVYDPDGDTMDVTFYNASDDSIIGTDTNVASGSTASVTWNNLAYGRTYHWYAIANDGALNNKSNTWHFTTRQNSPPNIPDQPSGPSSGYISTSYTYSTSTTDPDGDNLYYLFDWGDGSYTNWMGPYSSGTIISASHSWDEPGTYYVKAKAKDINGAESNWSVSRIVIILNHPPNIPSNPSPPNEGTDISIDVTLSWDGGDIDSGDNVTYYIYLGTNSNPPYNATIGPYPSSQTRVIWDPGILNSDTHYYWRVVAEDNHGAQSSSPIWNFTTLNGTLFTLLQVGDPSYNKWITSNTNLSFIISDTDFLNATYYRIWYDGVWHPSPGTAYGLNHNFSIFLHNFTLNDFSWSGEGLYIIEYYSDTIYGIVENIHNESYTVDDSPPWSHVLPFSFYAVVNIRVHAEGNDDASGIAYFLLYYQYSVDNSTWSEWQLYGNNVTPEWDFNVPEGVGYYRFASVAIDNLGNGESQPSSPDAICRLFSPDINGDGKVNILDIVRIAYHWNKNPYGNMHSLDLNGDGIINMPDLILVAQYWTG